MSEALFALDVKTDLEVACSQLTKAWERYALGEHHPTGVRPIILDSWRRCSASGLDARKARQPKVLSSQYVEHYLNTDRTFAQIKLDLPWLESAAADLGQMLVCCDAGGHIMRVTGASTARRQADRLDFVPGSDWSEHQAGTNAIGTAIVTRSPIQVLGSEHYLQAAHDWTCSAAPIRDPATNTVLAIIDLTGPKATSQRHALLLVMMFARLVEERLRAEHVSERNTLLEHYADQTCRAESAIAVVDRSGRVVKASPGLEKRGWIDRTGRVRGYSDVTLTAGSEIIWEAQGIHGRCTFALTPCLNRGCVTGAVVRVLKETPSRSLVSFPALPSRRADGQLHSFETLIGSAPAFLHAVSTARAAASAAFPILLEGESGTGKELVAEAIHMESRRRGMPFVAVNCGALSRELATSEFFGYDAGAFTGAAREGRTGRFEQANGGTLFLDEIGDMPVDLQALLLRVLEDSKVVHLGGRKNITVDVRVIVATNQNLLRAVANGTFRKDLYYRLSVINIKLPPLRERPLDILPLFSAHMKRVFAGIERSTPTITPEVIRLLERHSWPGNVREIRNLAEWLAVKCTSSSVEVADLPAAFFENHQPAVVAASAQDSPLEVKEFEMIQSTLSDCTGNITEAAKRLGIHRSTIYRKLGKHDH